MVIIPKNYEECLFFLFPVKNSSAFFFSLKNDKIVSDDVLFYLSERSLTLL